MPIRNNRSSLRTQLDKGIRQAKLAEKIVIKRSSGLGLTEDNYEEALGSIQDAIILLSNARKFLDADLI